MMRDRSTLASMRAAAIFAALICLAIVILAWLGYRASREWRRSSTELVERRVADRADLLATALTRDMQGAQSRVLASRDWEEFSNESLSDIADVVASTFARYPYPESFFGWQVGPAIQTVFFNRADRYPGWMPLTDQANRYPVVTVLDPPVASTLMARVTRDIEARRRYSIFETTLAGHRFQVVARLLYTDSLRQHPDSVFGFVVNLDWVRRWYFSEITEQVAGIDESDVHLDFAVLDEDLVPVEGALNAVRGPVAERSFPLAFFDPSLVTLDPPKDLARHLWSVRVSAADEPTLLWATRTADRTLVFITMAALAVGVSLLFTARALRASAALVEMRTEFVSTVTHELKTPLATIRAVGDTLERGRLIGEDSVRDYARLLVRESKRLTRLVDNILAYARVTDVTEVYSFEPQEPAELIRLALDDFRQQLDDAGFAVHTLIEPDLPPVRADLTSMRLALDNLIDNAIRYAGAERWLRIAAWRHGPQVSIEVSDHGKGIREDELTRVHLRFVRGRSNDTSGSGLGLAIVKRVVADHAGTIAIQSRVREGTSILLTLPVADDAEADSDH